MQPACYEANMQINKLRKIVLMTQKKQAGIRH